MGKFKHAFMALVITLSLFMCSRAKGSEIYSAISKAAATYSLDADFLAAVCWVESSHRAKAHNPKDPHGGAWGLCQLLPTTASWMAQRKVTGKELLEPQLNAKLAAKYLSWQLVRYKWNVKNAIMAYNAGRVKRFKRGPRKGRFINERYLDKVLFAWLKTPWRNDEAASYYKTEFEPDCGNWKTAICRLENARKSK